MVDKLDEGGVQADEGETVQFAAAWTLATPHRVEDRTQPRKSRTVERPFDNDVAVPRVSLGRALALPGDRPSCGVSLKRRPWAPSPQRKTQA